MCNSAMFLNSSGNNDHLQILVDSPAPPPLSQNYLSSRIPYAQLSLTFKVASSPQKGPRRTRGGHIYSPILSLNSALNRKGSQRHASAALPPENIPGTHCIGGRVGLRNGLDGCRKSRPHRNSIPEPSIP